MRRRIRWILCVGLIGVTFLLGGCLLNIFQTARTLGKGNVALTVGSGLFDFNLIGDETSYVLTPQVRLGVGVANGVDLGLQTGFMVPLEGGDAGWFGATVDAKFAVVDEPDLLALSLGLGGGFSLETLGWDVFAGIFLDSNLPFVPIFVVYQPHLALAEGLALIQHFAGGLKLRLSEKVRLLLQVDYDSYTYVSYGLAVEVEF